MRKFQVSKIFGKLLENRNIIIQCYRNGKKKFDLKAGDKTESQSLRWVYHRAIKRICKKNIESFHVTSQVARPESKVIKAHPHDKNLVVRLSTTWLCDIKRVVVVVVWTVKVRPHGQQFSRTTLYNKVVRHKTCRGHAKSCCATNVHIVIPIIDHLLINFNRSSIILKNRKIRLSGWKRLKSQLIDQSV